MRISIWQQFASNHSADFTIVGEFGTTTEANSAGDKLRHIIQEIVDWNEQHPDRQFGEGNWIPNPVEEYYAHECGIEWKEPIDWLRGFLVTRRIFRKAAQREPSELAIVTDRLVVVDVRMDITWQTGHHFVDLIQVLGVVPHSEVDDGVDPDEEEHSVFRSFEIDVAATAPSPETAERLFGQIQGHFRAPNDKRLLESNLYRSIPWIMFHPRYARLTKSMPENEYRAIDRRWIEADREWRAQARKNPSMTRAQLAGLSDELDDVIEFIRVDLIFDMATPYRLVGNTIQMTMKHSDFGERLPAFVGWMQAHACAMAFHFREIL